MTKPSVAGVPARAIIDASSLILLYKAGLIEHCCQMLQLLMTRSVFEEVTVPHQSGAQTLGHLTCRQPGIKILGDPPGPSGKGQTSDIGRLDRGERDTLLHYLNGTARFVVVDDGKAVRICRRYDIPHVNALLFPKLLYFSRKLSKDQREHFFSRLCSLGRYSAYVIKWARDCEADQLAFFLTNENKNGTE